MISVPFLFFSFSLILFLNFFFINWCLNVNNVESLLKNIVHVKQFMGQVGYQEFREIGPCSLLKQPVGREMESSLKGTTLPACL